MADLLWPVAVWFAEEPVRVLYAFGGAIIIGFSASWGWHNRKGK